uniref:Ig-like domain-containing protein n=1 Tax=Oryzias latipes TaxID=8090 RepID=A0A3P9LY90_ORYLA
MKKFLSLFFLCHTASAVKHSLKYFLTATSGTPNFPEFVGVATLDEVQIGYCDNLEGEAQLKQNWMKKLINKTPKHLKFYSEKCSRNHLLFKANMDDFKQRLNQTEGVHVLQRMNGCEWDDESGEIKGFNQYGYDGEDLIALDLKALTWIAPKAQFVVIKNLWNENKARLEMNKNYYMSDCPKLVQEYMRYGKSFLQRTEHPSVSLLQRTPSSLVSCHATGFYPDRADLFWRKDGEEIHEGVEKGQILPNHDGTFQMSTELNVSLIKHEDWRRYDCVFQLSGLTEDIVSTLNKAKIQTNRVSPLEFPIGPVVGGAAGVVLLLVLSGLLYCCWKRNDFQPVHGKEDDSSSK